MGPRLASNSLPLLPKFWDRTRNSLYSKPVLQKLSYVLRLFLLLSGGLSIAQAGLVLEIFLPHSKCWITDMHHDAWLKALYLQCWGRGLAAQLCG